MSFPPDAAGPQTGAREVVLQDMDRPRLRARRDSSFPGTLGQSEDHDAWTVSRMKRSSTIPMPIVDDVDRLEKLASAQRGIADEVVAKQTEGGALDLIDRSMPSMPPDLIGEMEELYALDDLTGALRVAELILGQDLDHTQASRCADNCRSRLIQFYSSKIGALDGVPVSAIDEAQVRWLGLDHRSGFLLSRIDSVSTVEEVLDVCGMPRLEALKSLADLLERGAIRVDRR